MTFCIAVYAIILFKTIWFVPLLHSVVTLCSVGLFLHNMPVVPVFCTIPGPHATFSGDYRYPHGHGFIDDTNIKLAGYSMLNFEREMQIFLSSRVERITSNTVRLNSGSSSKNNTHMRPTKFRLVVETPSAN